MQQLKQHPGWEHNGARSPPPHTHVSGRFSSYTRLRPSDAAWAGPKPGFIPHTYPVQVTPRKLRRSPSWSALNEVIFEKQHTRSDRSFVFMLKVGGDWGVHSRVYSTIVAARSGPRVVFPYKWLFQFTLHWFPSIDVLLYLLPGRGRQHPTIRLLLLRSRGAAQAAPTGQQQVRKRGGSVETQRHMQHCSQVCSVQLPCAYSYPPPPPRSFPACRGPYRQCLIAAPRCYCLISRYPFFSLHFQV